MQKKSKKVLTAVVTALFVLSVSYFALLSPTTAWYYQDVAQTYNFAFANFDVEQTADTGDLSVELRAATRFADVNEVLFDEVAHVVKVRVTNNSRDKALVHASVNQRDNNPPGLRWFVYETATADEINEAATPGTDKGVYKTAIETMLRGSDNLLTYTDETSYELANVSAIAALDAHNQKGIVLNANESKIVYVVLWAEYGDVVETLVSADTAKPLQYSVNVQCTAEPYYKQQASITIKSPVSLDIQYTKGTGAEAVTETIRVPGTKTISAPVGTRFSLTIPDSVIGYVFDAAHTDGTVSANNGKVVTGSVNSSGNTVTIVAG